MYIELNHEMEPIREGCFDNPHTVGMECSAVLTIYAGPFKCSYKGNSYSTGESVLLAIQNFLDGNLNNMPPPENNGSYYSWGRKGFEQGIVFADNIHPDIRNIIENAIDLKTGNDRNKLTEFIYREQQ